MTEQERTAAVLDSFNTWGAKPFSYNGDSDCCQFAAHVVARITGEDPARNFNYECKRQAVAILRANGGLVPLVAVALQANPTSATRDGDIAVVQSHDNTVSAAVRLGEDYVGLVQGGIARIDVARVLAGWSI